MLYRKYRSQKFSEILGQDSIVHILRQSILEKRVSHAYLFCGPRGTGKTSAARIMAKALNCLNLKDGEPCNQCANCKSITAGRFLDLIEIDAASNRGIEEIRELKEKIGFLPVEGNYKVYIIDEVHMLTGEAFNALLKTLEEPPKNVVFILATTEPQKLPATIVSRVQRYDFKLANQDDIEKKISKILKAEGYESEIEAISLIAQGAMGSFRDSETLLDKAISVISKGEKLLKTHVEEALGYSNGKNINKFISALVSQDVSKSLDLFNKSYESGCNISQFVRQVMEETRLKVLISVKENNQKDLKIYMRIIKEFNQLSGEIKFSLLPRLNVEMAILELCGDNPQKIDLNTPIEQSKTPEIVSRKTKAEKVDIKKIQEKWGDVIIESKNHNHHLVAVLSGAGLEMADDGVIVIVVPYSFHKNRLCDAETKKILEKIFKKVYGSELPYICKVNKAIAKENKDSSEMNEKLVEDILS